MSDLLFPQEIPAWAWVCPCLKSMPNSLTSGQVPPTTLDLVGLVNRSLGNAGTRSPTAKVSACLCPPIRPCPIALGKQGEGLQPVS